MIERGLDASHLSKIFDSFTELLGNLKDYDEEWAKMIKTGNLEEARRWLDSGGTFTARSKYDLTPMELAVSYKQAAIVRLLLERGHPTRGIVKFAKHRSSPKVVEVLEEYANLTRPWWKFW